MTEPLDDFTTAYIEAALWSSTDNSREDGGDPLDDNYTPDDLTAATLASMQADCLKFQASNAEDIKAGSHQGRYPADEQAGHDFWLTRNGHGAGFWDGDWPEPAASRLTASCKSFGTVDLYVGDDGRIDC